MLTHAPNAPPGTLAATPAALEALAAAGPEDVLHRPTPNAEVQFHITGVLAERDRRADAKWDDFIREFNTRLNNMRARSREKTESVDEMEKEVRGRTRPRRRRARAEKETGFGKEKGKGQGKDNGDAKRQGKATGKGTRKDRK